MSIKFKDNNGNLQDIGFLPNQAQLDALNSGIDANKVAQIQTNKNDILNKQNVLVSGQNIKTINNTSLLGSGNIAIGGSSNLTYLRDYSITLDKTKKFNRIESLNVNDNKKLQTCSKLHIIAKSRILEGIEPYHFIVNNPRKYVEAGVEVDIYKEWSSPITYISTNGGTSDTLKYIQAGLSFLFMYNITDFSIILGFELLNPLIFNSQTYTYTVWMSQVWQINYIVDSVNVSLLVEN